MSALFLAVETAKVTLNLTFLSPSQATSKCSAESDTYQIFSKVTATLTAGLEVKMLQKWPAANKIICTIPLNTQ